MRELELPNADFFAALVVFSLGIIVLWDGWMIWRSTKEIPSLGNLAMEALLVINFKPRGLSTMG